MPVERLEELLTPGSLDRFAAGADRASAFVTLWALLKDWSSANEHERRSRYFSSRTELVEWATRGGLEECAPSRSFHYKLQANRLNELSLNKIGALLEDSAGAVSRQRIRSLFEENTRLRFMREFEDAHLGADGKSEVGRAVGAARGEFKLGRLLKALGFGEKVQGLSSLGFRGVEFRFPVHVLEFKKR